MPIDTEHPEPRGGRTLESRGAGSPSQWLARIWSATFGHPVAPAAAIVALFADGFLHQLMLPLNHDVSWLVVATGRLLDGADVYGRDLVEFNPPMILYLFSPAVAVSRAFDLSVATCMRVYVLLLAAISLLLLRGLLKRFLPPGSAQLGRYVLLSFAIAFVVDRTRSFGQCEHFMLILIAPYLVAVASRSVSTELPRWLALCVGIGAGLGIALKPHYLLGLVVLEAYLALRRRSLRIWLRPEIAALVSVGIAYLLSLLLLTPAYLYFTLPLSLDTYWAYQKPRSSLVRWQHWVLLPLTALLVLLTRRVRALRELGSVLLLAGGCFYLAYLGQATGWRYHRIPFHGVMFVAACLPLLDLLVRSGEQRVERGWLGGLVWSVAVASLTLAMVLYGPVGHGAALLGSLASWQRGDPAASDRGRVGLVREHASGGSIYAFTGSVRLGFPLVTEAGVGWSSRFSHLWPLVAVTRWRDRLNEPGATASPAERARMEEIERYVTDAVIEDLAKSPPDLVFVEHPYRANRTIGREFDLLAHFQRDPRLLELWAEYEPLKSGLISTVYVRRGGRAVGDLEQ